MMKELNGINLKDAFADASKLVQDDLRASVIKALRHVLHEAHNASRKVERLSAELSKAEALHNKCMERLEKIQSGDWSAIPDIKEGQEKKKEESKRNPE